MPWLQPAVVGGQWNAGRSLAGLCQCLVGFKEHWPKGFSGGIISGSVAAWLQLGCSSVEEGMRSGKRRIAASAAIKGVGVVLEQVHAWDSHIQPTP